MIKISLILASFLAVLSGFFAYFEIKETIIPEYANFYEASFSPCQCSENKGAEIKINFIPKSKSKSKTPYYEIKEFPEKGKNKIIFRNVSSISNAFQYEEIAKNPLVHSLDYNIEETNLVLEIERKGHYLPLEIIKEKTAIIVFLKSGNENYPIISGQKPADNGTISPGLKKISFQATLKSPLKKAIITLQDNPVDLLGTKIFDGSSEYSYLFEFKAKIEKDEEYFLKAVITDSQDQAAISIWNFFGQVPVEAILGKDRFKYLGWWGQINTDNISVRQEPSASSTRLGSFSSANRVKVLKEVFGQEIGGNNIWYEIDGGKYPNSFVFSDFVAPLPQPGPPKNLQIPNGLQKGDYWIDVDISKKILTLIEYNKPVFATYVSVGKEENPTPTGSFKIWYKLKSGTMKGGPPLVKQKYELKNVPSIMYYQGSYAIHGTYWHDYFGTLQSAGCTNITIGDAAYIFEKTKPILESGKNSVFSSENNPGTVIYNHQ